eukprot:6128007-Ditylum_brightwellii.AAC.1
MSCADHEDFWTGIPRLSDDDVFIENALQDYYNDKSSKLVNWNQILDDMKAENKGYTIKFPKD